MPLDVAPDQNEPDEALDELLRAAADACAHTPGVPQIDGEDALSFLRRYYRHVAPEDLADRDPVDVFGPAMAPRHLAEHRPQGRAAVRVYTPSLEECGWDPGHTVVQIVTDD